MKAFQFKGVDSLGNEHYLTVTDEGRIGLITKSQIPLALANIASTSAVDLSIKLKGVCDSYASNEGKAQFMLAILRGCASGHKWTVVSVPPEPPKPADGRSLLERYRKALEIIAAGNTDPDRMVEIAREALK